MAKIIDDLIKTIHSLTDEFDRLMRIDAYQDAEKVLVKRENVLNQVLNHALDQHERMAVYDALRTMQARDKELSDYIRADHRKTQDMLLAVKQAKKYHE